MRLWRLVVRRLALSLVALAGLSVVIFAATEVLPGDAVTAVVGPDATVEQRDRARLELGLDRPVLDRYFDWAGAAVLGDLGTAYVGGRPVGDVIADRLPNSVLLGALALALAIPAGVVVGVLAGARPGKRLDRFLSTGSLLAIGIPEFVTAGLLLAILAIGLDLVPPVSLVPLGGGPLDAPTIVVLPVLSLAILPAAAAARLIRASVADTMSSPYVETARLNGIRHSQLLRRHVLPNSLGPAIQVLGLAVGAIIGGAIVVEALFSYPGIGAELSSAVGTRDLPLVQGIALVLAAITLLSLLLTDIAGRLLDPRLRT